MRGFGRKMAISFGAVDGNSVINIETASDPDATHNKKVDRSTQNFVTEQKFVGTVI